MRIKIFFIIGFCTATSLINYNANFATFFSSKLLSDLNAQDTLYPLKEYSDRKEGIIIPKEELVAGEKLRLISASIENSEPSPSGNISSYNLKFYLKAKTQVNIEVWEYDKSYKMEPFAKSYPVGVNKFSWPATIPLYHQIALKDLYPLAKIFDSDQVTYLPITLYHENSEKRGQYYSFGFIPLKSIDVLEYKIFQIHSGSPTPVYSNNQKDIPEKQKIVIQWNGKDQLNKTADSGLYSLVVIAKYTPKPGTRPSRPVTTKYQFHHQIDLLQK